MLRNAMLDFLARSAELLLERSVESIIECCRIHFNAQAKFVYEHVHRIHARLIRLVPLESRNPCDDALNALLAPHQRGQPPKKVKEVQRVTDDWQAA